MSDSAPNKDSSKRVESENYAAKIMELDQEIEDLVGRSSLHEGKEEERNEFYRRRNALYSQRKYYRKKMRIERLETERDILIVKNANVRSQNETLERMVRWATETVQVYELLVTRNPAAAIALTASLPGPRSDPRLASVSSGAYPRALAPSSASLVQDLTGMPSIPANNLGLSGSSSSLCSLSLAGAAGLLPTSHNAQIDQLLRAQQQADLLRQITATTQGLPTLEPNLMGHRRKSDVSTLQNVSNVSLPTSAASLSGLQMSEFSNSALLANQQEQQLELLRLLNLPSLTALGNLGLSSLSSLQPSLTHDDSSLLRTLQASTTRDNVSQQVLHTALSSQQAGRVSGVNVNAPKSVPGNEAAAARSSSVSSSSSSSSSEDDDDDEEEEEKDRKLPALSLPPNHRCS